MTLKKRLMQGSALRMCLAFLLVSSIGWAAAPGGLPRASAAFTPSTWTVDTYGGAAGSIAASGSKYNLQSTGANVWGNADSFTFVSQEEESLYDECSSVTITGTIYSISDYENVNASAGLMFRDSEEAGAKNVMLRVLPNGGIRYTYRTADGGTTANTSGPTLTFPIELKLVRQGNIFTAYYKQSGVWKLHKYVEVDMGTNVRAGIGAFSVTSNPITAEYGNLDIVNTSSYSPPVDGYVDPEPTASGLLLRDRFEDGSATNTPAAVNNPLWRGVRYACIVEDGAGNRAWVRDGSNGYAYAGSNAWTDYEASLDVKFDAASSGLNIAQLLVRSRQTAVYGNFCYAAGISGGNKLVLEKLTAGESTTLGSVGIASVLDGQWRTIKIRALDNTLNVYLDGVLKLSYTDDLLPNLRGGIGIRTEESLVQLDNVIVTKVDDPLGGDFDNWVGGRFDRPAP